VLTGAVKIHQKYSEMIASRGSQWGKRLLGCCSWQPIRGHDAHILVVLDVAASLRTI